MPWLARDWTTEGVSYVLFARQPALKELPRVRNNVRFTFEAGAPNSRLEVPDVLVPWLFGDSLEPGEVCEVEIRSKVDEHGD